MDMQQQFFGVGLVWNILRRYLPESISSGILGMRTLASKMGAVFDVPEEKAESFEDIFTHAKDSGSRMDFEISRCKELPELQDNGTGVGAPIQNNMRGGRQGGQSFGRGGGDRFGGGDRAPRQQRGNPEASVFIGNLSFTADEREVKQIFSGKGLNTQSVRILHGDDGRSKGSAFVDFATPEEAHRACMLDGQQIGNGRPLRINPANRR